MVVKVVKCKDGVKMVKGELIASSQRTAGINVESLR
jgi:hypothetical protein